MWNRPAALLVFLPALVVLSSILSGPIRKVRPRGLVLAIALAGAALGLATSIRWVGPPVGLIRLHPYQYVYYNELVGGVEGAFAKGNLHPWILW